MSSRPRAAEARGAKVWRLEPPLVRGIGLLTRPGRPSPEARAFVALATAGAESGQPKRPVM